MMIHIKCQDLFSLKYNKKNNKKKHQMLSAAVVIGALRVKGRILMARGLFSSTAVQVMCRYPDPWYAGPSCSKHC